MQKTTNYGLNKPEASDFYDVEHQNGNMDILDAKLKEIEEAAGQDAKTLNGKTADDFAAATHTHTKSEVGLGNVDNTADADKSVKYAASAGSVAWNNVTNKPSTYTPTAHTHTKSEISDFPSTMTPSAHNQAASTITAGTFAETVKAPASTTYTAAEVRNIAVVDTDPGEGVSVSYPNGTIVMSKA